LEFGAGAGIWTHYLGTVLRNENPITAAVFNREYVKSAELALNIDFVEVVDPLSDLPAGTFDYIVGSMMLSHSRFDEVLLVLERLLKPGGRLLFFERNLTNPLVHLQNPLSVRRAEFRTLRLPEVRQASSRAGLSDVQLGFYDSLPSALPYRMLHWLQSKAILLQHIPFLRVLCEGVYFSAQKPGRSSSTQPLPDLAYHPSLFGKVSVVIPCHNEASNIPHLIDTLQALYGTYLREIVIVNDNSTDDTADVAARAAQCNPKIKLLNRAQPAGVGRALRDGFAAASGEYILSMDCDFVEILPEFRNLFDAIAQGADGAIGSRFSHESVLLDYPWTKLVCNRAFHAIIKYLLLPKVRDITNNAKLYRADILKQLKIDSPHFAVNLETGLKPLLAGYNVVEVPISWINRTREMGTSKFFIRRVGGDYLRTLFSIWKTYRSHRPNPANAQPGKARIARHAR
jgi:SAM-dependent methyltransferase